ncbi:MAG: acyltransferase [Prevotella sp.]
MSNKKITEIDFVRCVLMCIVILVHIVSLGELYPSAKTAAFTFFMPSFLIITGYLVNINKNLRQFSVYILRIALPYIIMVTAFSLASLVMPVRDGLSELSVLALAERVFVTSIGPYWFLYDMIVCGVAYYAVFSLAPRSLGLASRLSLFACLLYVEAWFIPLLTFGDASLYFIGVALRQMGVGFVRAFRPSFFSLLPFSLLIVQRDLWHKWLCLLLPFFAISFLVWCHDVFPSCIRNIMNYLGHNTLPIYIFHPIFTMLSKFYLPFFAFDPTGILHAVATIVLSFLGSILIAKALDKTGMSRIFGTKALIR